MKKVSTFEDILEAANRLSLEEQEVILDILHRRMIEKKRTELISQVRESEREYAEGLCRETTPEELIKEILP